MTAETTSTSVAQETTTSAVPEARARVGVIGCSMTLNALAGYHALDGRSLWPRNGLRYGRGSVARWADPGFEFWDSFDAALEQHPEPEMVWWQLCTSGAEGDDRDHAIQVLDQIEARVPGATIVVSGQPGYTEGHVCSSAGPDGPAAMAALVDVLVDTGRVERGPVLAALRPEQLEDSCHANQDGQAQMGREILEFFDQPDT